MIDASQNLDGLSGERRLYTLQSLPKHLAEAAETQRLRNILTHFSFVEAKIKADLTYDLIRDYQDAIALGRYHDQSADERSARKRLDVMPEHWKPVVERDNCVEIAFWDREEFMDFVRYHNLIVPQLKKDIVWVTPSYSKLYYELAYRSIERKAYNDALAVLSVGLELEPDHPRLLCERGLAFSQLGQYEAARESYHKACTAREWASPSVLARAMRGLAVALIDLNQLEQAEKVLNLSLSLEPDNSTASNELSYIDYLRRGGSKDPKGMIVSVPDELEAWYWFVDQNSHQLSQHPDLLSQYALNQPNDSPVHSAALTQHKKKSQPHVRWINKPSQAINSALLRTLVGHTDTITSLAITPSSKFIVSGSLDRTVRVWNLATGEGVFVLHGHDAGIRTVALTLDGNKILTGDDQGEIRFWDLLTGRCESIIKEHKGSVRSLVCLDNTRACSGGDDGILRTWDLETATCVGLRGRESDIQSMAVLPRNVLISVSSSGTITRWNLNKNIGEPIATGMRPGLGSGIIPIGQEERVAVVVAMDVRIVDTINGSCLNTIKCHSGSIKDLAITPDGQYLITCGVDRVIQITQIDSGEHIATLPGHTFCVYSVSVSPDGRCVASGSGFENIIKIWNLDHATESEALSISSNPSGVARVQSIALSHDDRYVLSTHGESYGQICIRDALTGSFPRVFGQADLVHVCRDAKQTISVSVSSGLVQEWNLDQLHPVREFSTRHQNLDVFAFSQAGDKCAFVVDGRIEVVDLKDGQRLATLEISEEKVVRCLAISPDATVVIILELKELWMWKTKSSRYEVICSDQITPSRFAFLQGAIDFAGSLVMAGDVSGECVVLDLDTEETILTFKEAHPISAVAVDRASELAITGSFKGLIGIWSLADRECIATFHAEGPITACSIAPKNRILCGTMTGEVYLLELVLEAG